MSESQLASNLPATFVRKVEEAQAKLLDLTFRNKLLRYRPTKTKHLDLAGENPLMVFRHLVENQKKCRFAADVPPGQMPDFDPVWWTLNGNDAPQTVPQRVFLASTLEEGPLETKLRNLEKEAHLLLDEQGYNGLFLALGFLEWYESDQSIEPNLAPLVLVPVKLDRKNVRSKYTLEWEGEEPLHNMSLWAKLREFGITLPDPQDIEGVEGDLDELDELASLLEVVAEYVQQKTRWRILPRMALGFFSFAKYIMYRDLAGVAAGALSEEDAELLQAVADPHANPSLAALLDGDGAPPFDDGQVDELLDWRESHFVMDADPSQIAAIQDIQGGKSIIIEGPPGTGKSQTITNLIGELLAAGKKVLFVSEKKAALDVVKDRLDRVGIGPFSLELHSNKTTKKAFYEDLKGSFAAAQATVRAEAYPEGVEKVRRDLNEFAHAVGEPLYPGGPNPVQVLGRIIAFREEGIASTDRIRLPSGIATDAEAIAKTRTIIDNYDAVYEGIKDHPGHPFRNTDPVSLTPTEMSDLKHHLPDLASLAENVARITSKIAQTYQVDLYLSRNSWNRRREAILHLQTNVSVDVALLITSEVDQILSRLEPVIADIKTYQDTASKLPVQLGEGIWDQDIDRLREDYGQGSTGLFFLKRSYWAARRQYLSWFGGDAPRQRATVRRVLDDLVMLGKTRARIHAASTEAQQIFGSDWKAEASAPDRLVTVYEWTRSFRKYYRDGAFKEGIVEAIKRGVTGQQARTTVESLDRAWDTWEEQYRAIRDRLRPDEVALWGDPVADVPLDVVGKTATRWSEGRDSLAQWQRFARWVRELDASPLASLKDAMPSNPMDAATLSKRFELSLAYAQLDEGWSTRAALRDFDVNHHQARLKSFQELDRKHNVWSQSTIREKLGDRVARYARSTISSSEAGLVRQNVTKKRRQLSIRRLMAKAGNVVTDLKPCFLMSPISIAQYLEPGSVKFDVIVFDEASQVKPEDAYGALLRGRQVVVVGDSKQMPPTSFFDHYDEDDGEAEESKTGDFESILELCNAHFPESRIRMLRWHYRSRHESLIANSNREFYHGRLHTFPSPFSRHPLFGLKLNLVPDGVYGLGTSATNPIEATRVADDAIRFLQEFGGRKTLGLVAMSIKQQKAIEDAIFERLQELPELEQYFSREIDEPVFIKNLETVQGDERDVIFISIGYGFDANRKLSKNMGPINREGGERRLNVLFTRARERVHVYSNFGARDIPIDENSVRGLQVLKSFVHIAETGELLNLSPPSGDTDSPFEDSVKRFLESQNYIVHSQVGCSGYRIDLAVVHPDKPGTYALAVECDGATYHSSRVARERDRLRQQVLEDQKWNFYRVWSTDWFHRNESAKNDLLTAVRGAVEAQQQEEREKEGEAKAVSEPSRVENSDDDFEFDEIDNRSIFDLYQEAVLAGIWFADPFHETPLQNIEKAVEDVVAAEAPVHVDVVIDRIRQAAGVGRAGRRVREHITSAMAGAQTSGRVSRRGEFLLEGAGGEVQPRVRETMNKWKIEYIAPEEIRAGAKRLVEINGDCSLDDLAKEVARCLGFQRAREDAVRTIVSALEADFHNLVR